jgi:hypothetical protein
MSNNNNNNNNNSNLNKDIKNIKITKTSRKINKNNSDDTLKERYSEYEKTYRNISERLNKKYGVNSSKAVVNSARKNAGLSRFITGVVSSDKKINAAKYKLQLSTLKYQSEISELYSLLIELQVNVLKFSKIIADKIAKAISERNKYAVPVLYGSKSTERITAEKIVDNYNDISRDTGILLASIETTKKAAYKKI